MNIFRITWQVTLVEQEVFTLQEHIGSPTVFKGVRAAWSYVFCVVFCRSLVLLCTFSLYHSIICLSFNEFWFHMWDFQTFFCRICISEFVFNNILYNCSCWVTRSARWRIPYRSTRSPGSITSWINRRHLH